MARIKLSGAQALELIKQLGVDAELVADDLADKTLKFDDAIAAVDESRSAILRPDIEAALRTELTATLAGKHGGALRAHLRRLSGGVLKSGDLEPLKDEEAIQKFMETIMGQKDQSLDDIRNQMKTQLEEWEAEKTGIISTKDKELAELKNKYTEKDIDSILEEAWSKVPRTGGNVKTQVQGAKAYLRAKYKDHYDEAKRAIELRDMSNPEKPALNGNIAVQLGDVLIEYAKDFGVLKTDFRDDDPNKHIDEPNKGGGGPTFSAPGNFDKEMQSFEAQLG